MLYRRRVVQRPRADDFFALERIRLVRAGDEENRIAIRGDHVAQDLRRIVRSCRSVGKDLNDDWRERLDLPARPVQRDRPDHRPARPARVRGVAKRFSPRRLAAPTCRGRGAVQFRCHNARPSRVQNGRSPPAPTCNRSPS